MSVITKKEHILKRIAIVLLYMMCFASFMAMAQQEKVKNLPYVDNKLFHLGFFIGLHSQDLLLVHSGVSSDGEKWYAEIPSYSPGFSVGVIGDMYLNPYFNLRVSPSIHFGDKKFVFREENTGEEYETNIRSNYLMIPIDIKYSSLRLNNFRPYLLAGVYGAFNLGRKKGNPLLLKGADAGIEVGIGCDIYLPFFKLCPELKFCFGLLDVLDKNRDDIAGQETIKYSDALSKATSRMIILVFNFE